MTNEGPQSSVETGPGLDERIATAEANLGETLKSRITPRASGEALPVLSEKEVASKWENIEIKIGTISASLALAGIVATGDALAPSIEAKLADGEVVRDPYLLQFISHFTNLPDTTRERIAEYAMGGGLTTTCAALAAMILGTGYTRWMKGREVERVRKLARTAGA